MQTLNIIGGGRLGRTLARLWLEKPIFALGEIVTRSPASAQHVSQFIQSSPVNCLTEPHIPADIWLIATPDDQLLAAAEELQQRGLLQPGNILFHCSGSHSSALFDPIAETTGCLTASVHPVHSFAAPEKSLQTFAGTCCAYEGQPQALEVLLPAFEAIGAVMLPITADNKLIYHAGSVFACNYLVTLLQMAFECLSSAGLNTEQAQQLLRPLVEQTVDNVFNTSPAAALTGPIARGDSSTVARQLQQLQEALPTVVASYQQLGLDTVRLATQQALAPEQALQQIENLLQPHKGI